MSMNTKERILMESMRLFSIEGYEAVSIRAIAEAVGVGNSALYKHYKSKQAIFDAIVERCRTQFQEKIFVVKDKAFETPEEDTEINLEDKIKEIKEICLSMYAFQISNEWMVMFRRILMMEQFKNPEMGKIYRTFFIDMPVIEQARIFENLMEMGCMKDKKPEVLAMELYAPFYMYHMYEEDREKRMEMFRCHLDYFFQENIRIYSCN